MNEMDILLKEEENESIFAVGDLNIKFYLMGFIEKQEDPCM